MLFERVANVIPEDEQRNWEKIPDPVGYHLAGAAQLALASKFAKGGKAAYAAGSVAHAASLAEGAQVVGTTGTVSATSGSVAGASTAAGGTGAIGTTGTMAAGGSTVGTTAVGGTAVSGTGAVGTTGTVAAGGSTAGGTAAGSGTVATSHIGVGAKAAGLMHGGHAAALGSTAAKAGVAVAFHNPVIGIPVAVGLGYLVVRGKRGKGWNKKNKKVDDLTYFDMLEQENEQFEQAENPEDVVAQANLADEEIDEELAEQLRLGLVTTEPGVIQEKNEDAPAIQNERRTQTVA